MLYEIQCDLFKTKIDGISVSRPKIQFKSGLNTILGDEYAQNSIGKSTFLMIVDFCFGGDDYVNSRKCNAKDFVGKHTINFAFLFDGVIEYYSRNTEEPHVVNICDSDYTKVYDKMAIDDFRKNLFKKYKIDLPDINFRNIVGRYIRVWGRDNYNGSAPLKYGYEKKAEAIEALEKLFDVFTQIEKYQKAFEEKNQRYTIRKKAIELGEIEEISKTKTQVKKNVKEIKRLEDKFKELTTNQDVQISKQETYDLEQSSIIKAEIIRLKRKRRLYVNQLKALKADLCGNVSLTENDFIELLNYFPDANIQKLAAVDDFHSNIQKILSGEMSEEAENLEIIIDELSNEITNKEEKLRGLGTNANISEAFIKEIIDIQRQIDFLQLSNEGYKKSQDLKEETKTAKTELQAIREKQLSIIECKINEELKRINDVIYLNSLKKVQSPKIKFEETRKGNIKFSFMTQADSGTGTNYKGLIMYDIAILNLTQLPLIVHDSLLFKNIGDLVIDEIMQIYMKSDKQIIISFDKKKAFSDITKEIIDSTTILELHENGGELFGWSWSAGM